MADGFKLYKHQIPCNLSRSVSVAMYMCAFCEYAYFTKGIRMQAYVGIKDYGVEVVVSSPLDDSAVAELIKEYVNIYNGDDKVYVAEGASCSRAYLVYVKKLLSMVKSVAASSIRLYKHLR